MRWFIFVFMPKDTMITANDLKNFEKIERRSAWCGCTVIQTGDCEPGSNY